MMKFISFENLEYNLTRLIEKHKNNQFDSSIVAKAKKEAVEEALALLLKFQSHNPTRFFFDSESVYWVIVMDNGDCWETSDHGGVCGKRSDKNIDWCEKRLSESPFIEITSEDFIRFFGGYPPEILDEYNYI